jgi:SAM-dependent methyltransferase
MGADLPTTPIVSIKTDAAVSDVLIKLAASRIHESIGGFAFCNALFTFVESGLFVDLTADKVVDASASASRHGYDPYQALGLLRYLRTQGVLIEEGEGRFRPTAVGEAVLSEGALGLLRLYRGGYGELMLRAGQLLDRSLTYGRDLSRDGRYVATGANESTRVAVNALPFAVMEKDEVRTIADLGCGAGGFLIDFVKRSPRHRAIGIDVDPRGLEEARRNVEAAGVADQVKLVLGDAFDLSAVAKQCGDADLFYAFAMEHELLRENEDAVLRHIDEMAALFPGKRYLLGEPLIHMTREDGAFYWFHILSKQGLPRSVAGWVPLLRRLRRARLEQVFVPDQGTVYAVFDIRF